MRLAVIPARGGSKRILNKNSRYFCGKPIIQYSIEAAKKSGLFDEVVVSTDSSTIATLAIELGASVPFMRPKELATDTSYAFLAVSHAIYYFEELEEQITSVCCIYPTAPLLRLQDLKKGFVMLNTGQYDFVMATTEYEFPVYRSLRKVGDTVVPEFQDSINKKSQELPSLVHDVGQFYWSRPGSFHQSCTVFEHPHTRVGTVSIPKKYVQDLDTEEDWQRAEAMYKVLNGLDKNYEEAPPSLELEDGPTYKGY